VSEGTEAAALKIVAAIQRGEMSIADVMGPLTLDTGIETVNSRVPLRDRGKAEPVTAPAEEATESLKHNEELIAGVHPKDYVNPEQGEEEYDLVAIGAGVAGLLSVIMGNALGKKCVLIEKHYMGGDCLNVGCFPSKVLIGCARRAHEVRTASEFGVKIPEGEVTVDFGFVMERMRRLRAEIGSEVDSVARYKRDFCKEIYLGHAEFTGSHSMKVSSKEHGDRTIKFKKAMIGTGASALIPPIEGMRPKDGVPGVEHLTNMNIFNMTEMPKTMTVIGAGPIGMELAQAFCRFGCKVTVLEYGDHFLPREDPDASELVKKQMEADGIELVLCVRFTKVEATDGNITHAPFRNYKVHTTICGEPRTFESEAVLNGTGRAPNVHGLGLEAAGVEYDSGVGVKVNEFYQTANPDVYASGDVVSPFKFTHTADWSARLAIRNMFLGDTNTEKQMVIPWATYVDPEVAHVGMYEVELVERGIPHETFKRELKHIDRCKTEGTDYGFVKMHVKKGTDEILGCTIVSQHAGDMISEVTMCIQYGVGAAKLAGVMHPYPTQQEAVRQCAAQVNKMYKGPANKRALELLMETQTPAVSTTNPAYPCSQWNAGAGCADAAPAPVPGKNAWPECVGKPVAAAKAMVEAEGAGRITQVQEVPEGAMVTMDFREDRVRIFAKPDGTVASPPVVG